MPSKRLTTDFCWQENRNSLHLNLLRHYISIACLFHLVYKYNVTLRRRLVGGAVASWLVRSSPERVVRVRALAGDIVLCSWCLSPPRCINGYRLIVGET